MKRITNHIEATHALAASMTHTTPDGERKRPVVENPELNKNDPQYLRIRVPRKANTFKTIRAAREVGLIVDDVWQYDTDKANDQISMKLVKDD